MTVQPGKLVWMDLEMTGLDPDRCSILEMATIITDSNLEILAEGPDLVIHNTPEQLATLSDWSRETFGGSGLLDRVRSSEITTEQAEERTLAFILEHCEACTSPLCGNSVHMDRQFLYRHMRKLHDALHYRNVDVSTLKELLHRWWPERCSPPVKAGAHVALLDIRESIAELRYYRDTFIGPKP